jgi:hypothetical protein
MWGDRKLFPLKTHHMTNRQTASPDTQTLAPVSGLERDDFQITPFMALAVSLIYMLTADGEIDDHESSQLQAVVGNHNELLDISFIYAEENSVEEFIKAIANRVTDLQGLKSPLYSLVSNATQQDETKIDPLVNEFVKSFQKLLNKQKQDLQTWQTEQKEVY